MNITVIGGSRGTGAQVAIAARQAGHDVTVVSRRGTVPAGTRAVTGSATDPAVLREALAGADAVVVTVGATRGRRHARAEVTRAVIAAMKEAGVRRLLVQSSLGAGNSATQLPVPLRQVMQMLLRKPLADHNEQEEEVRTSGLDWTIVRPTGLRNAPPTDQVRALEVSSPETLSATVPRIDLARFMLGTLDDESTIRKAYGVSS
ncbi:NAD(P)-dependent oxidoreductase [Corynebacterium sp.]|uniref:NAD(P)-dependent oxidoreductase n=1 Tax=Corynebacterium sp. TaxID=1720 RepID=UPI0026E0CDFE|nr:NAD(P)-binding oxidoreductase [Corynebacterium sp.]MDO5513249.1 SDR family oxidoreductase [Corynebacterium sp.]